MWGKELSADPLTELRVLALLVKPLQVRRDEVVGTQRIGAILFRIVVVEESLVYFHRLKVHLLALLE